MSAEMRSFMEAYSAVHNTEVKENLDKGRDSISEMNLSQLTDVDLCEIAEEILEVMFAEGKTVAECQAIVEGILPSSTNPGRQAKIERLKETFEKVFGRVKEKSARTAVESYALYRKGKSLQDNWSRKFSHENGNVRLHNSLVVEDRAGVKNGLLKMVEAKKGDGNLANNYPPYDKVTRGDVIAGATGKDQLGGKNIRGNDSAEQKKRLEKKRGMKLDDHPQFKEELEATGKFTAQEIEAIIKNL
jgi:hypothetical protein